MCASALRGRPPRSKLAHAERGNPARSGAPSGALGKLEVAQDAPTGYGAVRHGAPTSERPAAASQDHGVSFHCFTSEETTVSVTDVAEPPRPTAGVD
jgi:hypothetical protein